MVAREMEGAGHIALIDPWYADNQTTSWHEGYDSQIGCLPVSFLSKNSVLLIATSSWAHLPRITYLWVVAIHVNKVFSAIYISNQFLRRKRDLVIT